MAGGVSRLVEVDAAIVGAGPSGSAAAIALRRRGLSAAVVEKASFPRHKMCGDFLTPGAVGLLRELAPGTVEALGPRPLAGMRITHERAIIEARFPEGRGGWALSRRDLDDALARCAEAAGALMVRPAVVRRARRDASGLWDVQADRPDGSRVTVRARLLVEAGGRHGVLGRRLGWRREDPALRRYALWSHMEGVRGLEDRGEMHVVAGGYVGVSGFDPSLGVANVTMVIVPDRMARARSDPRGYFLDALSRHPLLARRCRDARFLQPLRGIGPMACRAPRLAGGGLAMVGDAGGFIDPFTGEGVFVALASARLLDEEVGEALRRGLPLEAPLARYNRRHKEAFRSKFLLCRLLQRVIAHPFLARRVTRALASSPELADRMVGATGGLLPAGSVLSPAFLARLLAAGMSA
ncbi:MAG TPA: NAD(P)/FAD-dependent oxidoreductase [Candidatus Polarisedimenticolia bacterium]|nr:NAD(P)/FAD-dependent oxidoreductase [Candidatus Polarisedimenticolia bacterium]